MAGYSLESSSKKALDDIFQDLATVKPNLHPPVSILVESVFTLRTNNWGRTINTVVNNNRYVILKTAIKFKY